MSILLSTPAIDNATDNWSSRFDEAQARYRRSQANRLDVLHAETTAVLAKIDADLAENRARSEANRAKFEQHVAEMEAAEAVEVDVEESDPATWGPETDEVWGADADPLTIEELLKGVPHYGTDGPARHADADEVARAWHSGYVLGESGYEAHQVAPPEFMTGREASSFMAGVEVGAAERWADYERHLAEQEAYIRIIDSIGDASEAELAYAGSAVGHMA